MARRPDEESPPSLASRLAWLVLIWGAGVAGLALVAAVLRFIVGLAGLTTGGATPG